MASSEGENFSDVLSREGLPQNGSSDMESAAKIRPLSPQLKDKTDDDDDIFGECHELAKGDGNYMVNGTSYDSPDHMEMEIPIEDPKTEHMDCSGVNQNEDESANDTGNTDAETARDSKEKKVSSVNSSSLKNEEMVNEGMSEKDKEIGNEDTSEMDEDGNRDTSEMDKGIGNATETDEETKKREMSMKNEDIENRDLSKNDEEVKNRDESEKNEDIRNRDLSEKDEEIKSRDVTERDEDIKNRDVCEKGDDIKNEDASTKDEEMKSEDVSEKIKETKNEHANTVDDDVVITSCEEKLPKAAESVASLPNDVMLSPVRNTRSATTVTQAKVAPQSAYPVLGQPKLGITESAAKLTCTGPSYRPVAKLLISIGLELVREGVIKNLIDIQAEKDKLQKLDAKEKTQLDKLEDSWKSIVRKNEVYRVPVRRCRCTFSAFTLATLDLHRQFGRSTRPGRYRCCYCARFRTHIPAKFIAHMTKEHQRFARLQPIPLQQCPFCPFEHKQATHLDRHVNSCQKKFALSRNLQFTQNVFDIPVFETKPRLVPMQGPPKPQPVGFPRPGLAGGPNQGRMAGPGTIHNPATGLSVTDILSACGLSPQIQAQVLSNLSMHSPSVLGRGQAYSAPRSGFQSASRPAMSRPGTSAGSWMQMPAGPRSSLQSGARISGMNLSMQQQRHLEQLSRGMQRSVGPLMSVGRAAPAPSLGHALPVARRTGSTAMRANHTQFARKCEICDLPVADLERLRLHLGTVHREPLESAEFHRRGQTLTCHVCAETFYTKQGALRHYQVQHGATVPRAYHCIKCGAKVVTSILNHLSSQHNVTVLDMYEAKYCMLCNTRLKSLIQFETHVVGEHADIFPNRMVLLTMIKALNAASLYKTMGKPDLGPMRPLPPGFSPTGLAVPRGLPDAMQFRAAPVVKARPKERYACQSCCVQFATPEELAFHCERDHMFKCSRCAERWSSLDLMHRHFMSKHHNERDACILCGEPVQIGRPTVRHIKRMHIRACSVVVPRLRPQVAMRYLTKRRRLILLDSQRPGCSGEDGAAKAMSFSEGNAGENAMEDAPKVEEIMEVDGEMIVIQTNG